jgi:hypothetical protein
VTMADDDERRAGITGRDGYLISQALDFLETEQAMVRVMGLKSWEARLTNATEDNDLADPLSFKVAYALYLFINHQQTLSVTQGRQWSNEQDMKAILLARLPDYAKIFLEADPHPADLTDEKAKGTKRKPRPRGRS